MVGRGFRGANARIVFSTQGANQVLGVVKGIDSYFMKLSRDVERYANISQRIAASEVR
jgi:hypothetical protein